jgi:hypothetical protein
LSRECVILEWGVEWKVKKVTYSHQHFYAVLSPSAMLEHLVPVWNLAPAQAMRRRSGMDLRNTLGRKGFGCDIGVIVGAE